eukprot:Rhum_TRINITY_DN7904_c0_g1::Rhum_TRINITY_DN7904_c0_g1_i1::g.25122::m.25122
MPFSFFSRFTFSDRMPSSSRTCRRSDPIWFASDSSAGSCVASFDRRLRRSASRRMQFCSGASLPRISVWITSFSPRRPASASSSRSWRAAIAVRTPAMRRRLSSNAALVCASKRSLLRTMCRCSSRIRFRSRCDSSAYEAAAPTTRSDVTFHSRGCSWLSFATWRNSRWLLRYEHSDCSSQRAVAVAAVAAAGCSAHVSLLGSPAAASGSTPETEARSLSAAAGDVAASLPGAGRLRQDTSMSMLCSLLLMSCVSRSLTLRICCASVSTSSDTSTSLLIDVVTSLISFASAACTLSVGSLLDGRVARSARRCFAVFSGSCCAWRSCRFVARALVSTPNSVSKESRADSSRSLIARVSPTLRRSSAVTRDADSLHSRRCVSFFCSVAARDLNDSSALAKAATSFFFVHTTPERSAQNSLLRICADHERNDDDMLFFARRSLFYTVLSSCSWAPLPTRRRATFSAPPPPLSPL